MKILMIGSTAVALPFIIFSFTFERP